MFGFNFGSNLKFAPVFNVACTAINGYKSDDFISSAPTFY